MKTRKLLLVSLLILLVLSIFGNFGIPIKGFFATPSFIHAGNPNELPFETGGDSRIYRNGTWQTENWIYFEVSTMSTDTIDTVLLMWKNETGWYNYTMTPTGESNRYEVNITNQPRYDGYAYNVWANDSLSEERLTLGSFLDYESSWGAEEDWRRYIGLNSNPEEFAYEQLYFRNVTEYNINQTDDRTLPHEQVTDGSEVDTGTLLYSQPTGSDERYCSSYIGFSIDETLQMEATEIENIYVHVWWSDDNGTTEFSYEKEMDVSLTNDFDERYTTSITNSRKNITLTGFRHTNYYLEAKLWNIINQTFNDNDINTFTFKQSDTLQNPSIISTQNYSSFLILNLPDNATLQGLDTDSDGLTDYDELFIYYSDPKDSDTDGGDKRDKYETDIGRDALDTNDDGFWLTEALMEYNKNLIDNGNPYISDNNGTITSLNYKTNKLSYTINASTGQTTITKVYSDQGEPQKVEGADDWTWDPSGTITISVTHQSSRFVSITWRGGATSSFELRVHVSMNKFPYMGAIVDVDGENKTTDLFGDARFDVGVGSHDITVYLEDLEQTREIFISRDQSVGFDFEIHVPKDRGIYIFIALPLGLIVVVFIGIFLWRRK